MPHFFENITSDNVASGIVKITGENANHIINALRMSVGEKLTLSCNKTDYLCELTDISGGVATAAVLKSFQNKSEPNIDITLYQCIPKGDKLETVIQKSVELGVFRIVPVLSSRCVSRPDNKKAQKKCERYNKIAKSACEQSQRGRVVEVLPQISFEKAVKEIKSYDTAILCYEGGGIPLANAVKKVKSLCIFIGPEGGFSDSEVEILCKNGAVKTTLGKRILRTETAPIAAICAVMLLTGNLE